MQNEWMDTRIYEKTNKIYTEMNTSINKSVNKQTHTQFNQWKQTISKPVTEQTGRGINRQVEEEQQ